MSTGTNQERIQQNNAKLTALKTKTDTLPEYQDMSKIYHPKDYSQYNIYTDWLTIEYSYAIGFFVRCGNFCSYGGRAGSSSDWSNKFAMVDELGTKITLASQSNIWRFPINYDDENVYSFCFEGNYNTSASNTNAYIEKFNFSTKEAEKLFNVNSGLPSNNATCFTLDVPYKNTLIINHPSTVYKITFDIPNKTWSIKTGTGDGNNNYKLDTFLYAPDIYHIPSKIYRFSNGKSISNTDDKFANINFINYASNKCVYKNDLYYLNENMTLGELIKTNCIPNYTENMFMTAISSNIYTASNMKVYRFDDVNNTFTVELDFTGNTLFRRNTQLLYRNGYTMKYLFEGEINKLVGYKVDGNELYLHKDYGYTSDAITPNNTLYDYDGNAITGTMPNNGALTYTPSTSQQTIPAGYTSGGTISAVTASIDSDIQAGNIKSGVNILGVTGNYEGDYSETLTPEEYEIAVETAEEILDGQVTPVLPYTELEYIESTGTQYIDTGIVPSVNFKYEIKYEDNTATGSNYVMGSRINADATLYYGVGGGQSALSVTCHNTNVTTPNNYRKVGYSYIIKANYNSELTGTGTIECIDTGDVFTGQQTASGNPTANYCVFGVNSSQLHMGMSLYYLKLWNNDILVRDFIPVKRTSDNEICMYDKVSNQFFTNQGAGTFIAGPEVN